MTKIITESFAINLKVLRLCRLYSSEKMDFRHRVQAFLLYIFFIIPVPVLGSAYLLFNEDIDFAKVADNAFLLGEMGCYIVKFLLFIVKSGQVTKCIHFFESPFFEMINKENKDLLEECKQTCRKNNYIFLASITMGFCIWALKPFFWKGYRLPIDIWLPFTPDTSIPVYYSVYLFLVVGVAYAAFAAGAMVTLLAGLICHAATQVKILKKKLQNLTQNNGYQDVKTCVNHHTEILNFVEIFEDCFSWSIFSQFAASVFVICISLLQLTMVEPMSFSFFFMAIYFTNMLAEIFFFCYYGTTLYNESNTIIDAVYMGVWYELDDYLKKDLLILMERVKRPVVITAGKFFEVSLVTFTTILRRSYSLLAVLQTFQ